jgi:hypothetical protein
MPSEPDGCAESELCLSRAEMVDLMRAVLDKGAPFRFRARGRSMSPFIRDGDFVSISPPAPAEPFVGQVVAFVRGGSGQLVVHRVIAAGAWGYRIQGDNAPGIGDAAVQREQILGCVTRVTRQGRVVRLGLGPERRLIALLSRAGWLRPLRARLAALRNLLRGRGHGE